MNAAEAVTVGILIPTFNRRTYLGEALKSVLSQSWSSLEVIVIDNGSTDGTAEMMAAVSDARVRYLVNPQNLGLLGSINKGVRLFSSAVQWLTILPDDDMLEDGFISAMVARQTDIAARAVIQGRTVIVDARGKSVGEARSVPPVEAALDYLLGRAQRRRESYLTGVYFSRVAFESIGGYPQFATGMATDDAFIFALASTDRLYGAPQATACMRLHSEAESQQVAKVLPHINALQDFKRYVMTRVTADESLPETRRVIIVSAVDSYVRSLASGLWVRNVKELFRLRPTDLQSQLDALVRRVAESSSTDFSWRVRVSAYLTGLTGHCPERYLWYRAIGEILKRMKIGL
jgi:glycosyltransferase involved in cell wall biosynthesis